MMSASVGKPVRGSKTDRPVMALLDILGRRWALRLIWELRDGPLTSRALRARCDDVSPTVLQARINELREAGFVRRDTASGYHLTAQGQELGALVLPLHRFADRWATQQSQS
jgi:DNA-binding HxlR family transcriptional regulator